MVAYLRTPTCLHKALILKSNENDVIAPSTSPRGGNLEVRCALRLSVVRRDDSIAADRRARAAAADESITTTTTS